MKTLFSVVVLLTGTGMLYSQNNVAINTSGEIANACAMLDISATNMGLLIPRVNLTATNNNAPIGATVTTSLLIYNQATVGAGNTAVSPGYYYWNGTQWVRFVTGALPGPAWMVTGNTGTNPATHFIGTTDPIDFVIRTDNTEKIRVLSGGNVGIGIANPLAKLHVAGGGQIIGTMGTSANTRTLTILDNSQAQVNFGSFPGNWTSALQIQNNDNTRYVWLSPLDNTSGANARLVTIGSAFDIYPGNVYSTTFATNGNVGIGTTVPGTLLSVGGAGFNVYGTSAWVENNLHVQGYETLLQGGRGRLRVGTVWGYIGLFAEGSSSVVNNDLLLGASSGLVRVGPGTGQNLFVSGQTYSLTTSNVYERTTNANGIWATEQFDGNIPGVHIYNSEAEQGGFFANGNYCAIYSPADNDLVKFMDEDFFTNVGTVYDNNAMRARIDGAGQYFQISDKNLKENILPINNALNKISKIGGYSYTFKLHPNEIAKGQTPKQTVGILAQELELVLPEAVSNTDGQYMVNYAAIIPLLIEGIKEQNEKIKLLEQKVQQLEGK